MLGSAPATSQLDWLSSTTAMIVLSWSKTTRDLLKSFSWGIRALHQLDAATMVPFPRRLPHTISPLEGDGFEPSVPRKSASCFRHDPANCLGTFRCCARELGLSWSYARPAWHAQIAVGSRMSRGADPRGTPKAWARPVTPWGVKRRRRNSIRRAWSSHRGSGTWHPRQTSRRCHPGRC